MAIDITDSELQEQLKADIAANIVPKWDPKDQTKAQQYVQYYNTLFGRTVLQLSEKITYEYEVVNQE